MGRRCGAFGQFSAVSYTWTFRSLFRLYYALINLCVFSKLTQLKEVGVETSAVFLILFYCVCMTCLRLREVLIDEWIPVTQQTPEHLVMLVSDIHTLFLISGDGRHARDSVHPFCLGVDCAALWSTF